MNSLIGTAHPAKIAAKRARSPEVKELFEQLSRRYATLARMQSKFTEAIKRNRALREGKSVKIGRREKRILEVFNRDAERARQEIERLSRTMDDQDLLTTELSHIQQMIKFDERMLSAWHTDDKPQAEAINRYQRKMLKLVKNIIQNPSAN